MKSVRLRVRRGVAPRCPSCPQLLREDEGPGTIMARVAACQLMRYRRSGGPVLPRAPLALRSHSRGKVTVNNFIARSPFAGRFLSTGTSTLEPTDANEAPWWDRGGGGFWGLRRMKALPRRNQVRANAFAGLRGGQAALATAAANTQPATGTGVPSREGDGGWTSR
jgi:hypothetical protein